jgi:hypothetical protein
MMDTNVTIADVRVEHHGDALGSGASQPGYRGSSRRLPKDGANLLARSRLTGWLVTCTTGWNGSLPTSRCLCSGRSRCSDRASTCRMAGTVADWGSAAGGLFAFRPHGSELLWAIESARAGLDRSGRRGES